MENATASHFARRCAIALGPWLLLALLFTPGTMYYESTTPDPDPWHYVFTHYLSIFMLWAAFVPIVARVLARWPLDRPRAVAVHFATALALGVVHAFAMGVYDLYFPHHDAAKSYLVNVGQDLLYRGGFNLLVYAMVVAVLSALDALRRQQASERSLVAAKLDALKAQLEPHFLFNTLNALSELVYRDAAAADRALTALAGLLRRLLDQRAHEHALETEIALLREYVAIQQVLLGDRLRLDWRVPDELARAKLPTLLLQPLVENAINHGIAQLKRGGTVTVAARGERDRLVVTIDNDGPPAPAPARDGGIGLSNARARLAALYGARASLLLEPRADGGCRVTIELPLAEAA